ncbi:hypothetical protein BDR04DRAFT_1174891 [Suillus decipiens]|nr:hypothetical protein BDR04DRAFT_1174891 [Suillus decipiens]
MAFVLIEVDCEIDVTNVVKKVQALMGGPVATLDKKVDELEKMIDKHRTTLEHTTSEITECVTTSDHNNTMNAEMTAHGNTRTYATVTKNGTQTPTAKIMACNEAQACQILIERRSLNFTNTLRDLTENQLVAKVNLAMEAVMNEAKDVPQNIKFISAR